MMTEKEISPGFKTDLTTLTIQEAGTAREKLLDETHYILGRGSDCGILLADNNVSRHHAKLEFNGASWVITDLDSANGTFVNGSNILR